jgi:hypothetical protein
MQLGGMQVIVLVARESPHDKTDHVLHDGAGRTLKDETKS